MSYVPKPHPDAYRAMCARFAIAPERALFVEDMARNLEPAKALGMTTVWVDNGSEQAGRDSDPAFIDYRTTDIGEWLTDIVREEEE
jgi:putative hydrolase of the HAD superfamily